MGVILHISVNSTILSLRCLLKLPDGHFWVFDLPVSLDWLHFVLNCISPEEGTQGIRIYLNGILEAHDTMKSGLGKQIGDGRVVIGRQLTDLDERYASVGVDELFFFNQILSDGQIMNLKNNWVFPTFDQKIYLIQLIRQEIFFKNFKKAFLRLELPIYWSTVGLANHYTNEQAAEWETQQSCQYLTVMLDWF